MVKDIILSLALALLLLEVLRLNRTLSAHIKTARRHVESVQAHTILEVTAHVNKTAKDIRELTLANRDAIAKVVTVVQMQDAQINELNTGFRLVSQKIDIKDRSLNIRVDGVLKLIHEKTK